jgi:hypothetical protein
MGANAIGQVFMASGAPIRAAGEGTREQLVLPEGPGAWRAHRYGMVPAIVKKKSAFFAAEPSRQATAEVDHAIAVAFDGVFGGDPLANTVGTLAQVASRPPRGRQVSRQQDADTDRVGEQMATPRPEKPKKGQISPFSRLGTRAESNELRSLALYRRPVSARMMMMSRIRPRPPLG